MPVGGVDGERGHRRMPRLLGLPGLRLDALDLPRPGTRQPASVATPAQDGGGNPGILRYYRRRDRAAWASVARGFVPETRVPTETGVILL